MMNVMNASDMTCCSSKIMSSKSSISAYRHLLRTVHKTFKGDFAAIGLAYGEIRAQFNASKHLTAQRDIDDKLAEAKDAQMFIAENIVQAEKSSSGTLSVSPENAKRLKDITPDDILKQ
ncbi:hypothetical protein CEUSTIGMA_g5011.t1 [Chlamydomonas eustigma]|uniref:Uncharacterized protein n=1 Tax=Chlamydomonas eustigma TaxID=1157962 RepID=A0A250X3B6_9CHLO|nr:hypothetical protein CEUSTIGMA_g5011.t1 [Chlamydomonas eustigma]|eukprot:GAX77567.1 hypothetical protein CEUSTIGMA_g5011.t1 [Chlamydomonas eustigma]